MRAHFLLTTALAVGIFTANAQSRSGIPYGNNEAAGHYVQADGARLYYEVYGQGDPVLVLHGGGVGSIGEMGQFIDSLSRDHQVIALNTRGHRRSEIGDVKFTYEQRADDAYAALRAVTDKPALVIGFSDGAYSGYKLASKYPDAVEKLVAMGAGENVVALRKVPVNNAEQMGRMAEEIRKVMPEPDRLQEFYDRLAVFYNEELIASKELFMSIKCPVLVMSGEIDGNAPLDTVISAYKMIPDAQLAIIANAGHVVFMNNFAAVWANIVPFLKK